MAISKIFFVKEKKYSEPRKLIITVVLWRHWPQNTQLSRRRLYFKYQATPPPNRNKSQDAGFLNYSFVAFFSAFFF